MARRNPRSTGYVARKIRANTSHRRRPHRSRANPDLTFGEDGRIVAAVQVEHWGLDLEDPGVALLKETASGYVLTFSGGRVVGFVPPFQVARFSQLRPGLLALHLVEVLQIAADESAWDLSPLLYPLLGLTSPGRPTPDQPWRKKAADAVDHAARLYAKAGGDVSSLIRAYNGLSTY